MSFGKHEREEHAVFNFDIEWGCSSKHGAKPNQIMMYRRDFEDKKKMFYVGEPRLSDLSPWIKTHLVPPLFEFDIQHDKLILG